jgi:hypothetical protein
MSEETNITMVGNPADEKVEKTEESSSNGKPDGDRCGRTLDLIANVVFAKDVELRYLVFADFEFPFIIERCKCENVEITRRSIAFNPDSVTLCVDYIICIKFFPLGKAPYCQSFNACFTKTIPYYEFRRTPGYGNITREEFAQAEGAAIDVRFVRCFCFIGSSGECFSSVLNDVYFDIIVKLIQERGVEVRGELSGGPVVTLPKESIACGIGNFATESCVAEKAQKRLEGLSPQDKARYEAESKSFKESLK